MGVALTLSYKQTEALIRAMHDIDDQRAPALFARFKYLQRMDFPDRPSVGRGSRVGYRFEEVMQLVLVFQLMEVGIAPLRIVRILRTGWTSIRATLANAHRQVKEHEDDDERETREDLLVITPAALLELGVDEDVASPIRDGLETKNRYFFDAWLIPDEWLPSFPSDGPIPIEQRACCKVLIDLVRVVILVKNVLVHRFGQPAELVDAAFRDMADAA